MKRGKGTGNTGTPAANAATRKKGNTHGKQRGPDGEPQGLLRERHGMYGSAKAEPASAFNRQTVYD
jgi:hypothetical protein